MKKLFVILCSLLVAIVPSAFGQDAGFDTLNRVEATKEFKMEPQKPSTYVLRERQLPAVAISELKVPLKDFVLDTAKPVKPSLVKLSLKEVQTPRAFYNKPREVTR